MQSLHPDFLAVLANPYAHFAYCLRLESTGGQKWFFTSYDFALLIGDEVYLPGLSPMAIESLLGTQLASGGVEGVFGLSPTVLEENVFASGVLHGAIGRFFLVDPFVPPKNLTDSPPRFFEFPSMRINSLSRTDSNWQIDYVDIGTRLSRRIGIETSKYCRAVFGDSQCGINLAAHTSPVQTVVTGSTRQHILFNSSYSNEYFMNGRILFKSGNNNNVSRAIAHNTSQAIALLEPLPFTPVAGDTFVLIKGCAHTKVACIAYGNIQNFRGESSIPGASGYAGGK